MRRYKRNEPFRFNFDQPMYCCFFIKSDRSHMFDGVILDLSPNGLKIRTPIDLLIDTKIEIAFHLNNTLFDVKGLVRWKKTGSDQIAGIQLENDEFTQQRIIEELKFFVKREQKTEYS
ncbi:hypothetical protein BTR23_09090 [Alkalihalophilus pseudofirmus]|nr:hypothetical protein BTR23_09090 [Alkalihalophilus pseudofirmus]